MFAQGQGRRFTCGADGDKAVRALFDMPVDKFLEALKIQLAVLERRDEGGQRPVKHDTLLSFGGQAEAIPVADPRR
ncbi:hypothetical protein GCM10011360_35940 [Primorskyibacter flagellatus]|uniref:Uncharacterized protein n=1 Tax=Primorskyibacter flagellatus TaxID=1387277 RepID=A0A917EHS3_9RHOB|nr:hypothetical protein GCM10011360_35940 [Primorskyibacter flagellatus]